MMSSKEWKCSDIHTDTFDQLNRFNSDLAALLVRLRKEEHLESYFFNRYANSEKNVYFLKVGLVNADEQTQSDLDTLLGKHGISPDCVIPYDCEMWEVDGVPIDEIKCISAEIFEILKERFAMYASLDQMVYLLHFLMNQLGLDYEKEMVLYNTLIESIKKEMEKAKKRSNPSQRLPC